MATDDERMQNLLRRMAEGDMDARREFLGHMENHVRELARNILNARFPRMRGVTDPASRANSVMVRLLKFEDISAPTVKDFLNITASYIEKRLINLAKQLKRRRTLRGFPTTDDNDGSPLEHLPCPDPDPRTLAEGRELLERAQTMPGDLREVMLLCGYLGFNQREAASILGLTAKQVSRAMEKAREALGGDKRHAT